jgi:hypothetical protein
MIKGPQTVDWAGIRAAAVVMGIRNAARKAAQNLPEYQHDRFVNRVMRRASREKWIAAKEEAVSAMSTGVDKTMSYLASGLSAHEPEQPQVLETPSTRHAKPLSAPVLSGSELLSGEVLTRHEKRTFLARVVRTPLSEVSAASDLCAEEVVTESDKGTYRKIKALDKLKAIELDAKLMGEFQGDQGNGLQINLLCQNVTNLHVNGSE